MEIKGQHPEEAISTNFDQKSYFEARELCLQAIEETVSDLQDGMNYLDGISLMESHLKEKGCEKFWHPSKFRIGTDTVKSFREESDTAISLSNGTPFFIDIGPVFFGHEADLGRTFVHRDSVSYPLAAASQSLFKESEKAWRDENLSGEELYKFAAQKAEKRGFELVLKMDGHRLGDFPHALHYKGSLTDINYSPAPYLWVLEILIKDPQSGYGAFFEDILGL